MLFGTVFNNIFTVFLLIALKIQKKTTYITLSYNVKNHVYTGRIEYK